MNAIDNALTGESARESPPHDKRRVAANFLALTLSNVATTLIGLFTSIYVRRLLGPVAIGQVSWNMSVLSYLALATNPGLQLVGQREIARDPRTTERLVSLILAMQLLFAVAAFAVTVGIAALNLKGPEVSLLLVLQGLSLFLTAFNLAWVLQAHERMVEPAIASLVLNLLQVPALVALIHGPDDVYIYVVYSLPFSLAGIAYNVWYLRRKGLLRLDRLRPTLSGARKILAESWPMALSQASILVYYNSDSIILGFTHGDETVGLYATAYRLMLLSTMVSGALWNAYFPALVRAQADPRQSGQVTNEFVTVLAWIGLPMAALGWACGRHPVALLYGPMFAESGVYFEWLCLNIGLIFINSGIGTPLLAWGHQKALFKISAFAALTNLALNLLLIPICGVWAAIVTTIGAELVIFVLRLVLWRRVHVERYRLLPIVLPPLLCSAAVAAGISLLPPSVAADWWLTAGIGAAVLGACIYMFERRIVTTALKLVRRA